MTEIEKLKDMLQQIQEAKSKSAKLELFAVTATIREQEKKLLQKITDLTTEAERVIKYTEVHLRNP